MEKLRGIEYEAYGITGPVSADAVDHRDSLVFLQRIEGRRDDWFEMAESFREVGAECSLIALDEDAIPEGFHGAIGGPPAHFETGIVAYLGEFKARGHRRYVRFGNQNASIATFEFHRGESRFAGIIHDISVGGCSCTFKPEPEDFGHIAVEGMRINLPGHKTTVSGRFASRRLIAGQIIHVFLFTGGLSESNVEDIHDFIYSSLETKLSFR